MLKLTDLRHLKKLSKPFEKIKKYFELRRQFKNFKKLSEKTTARFPTLWEDVLFFSKDNTANTEFDTHYIYHPAWAARILAETKPEFHVDISSTLHFCSIVSAFVPIKFYDYRPAHLTLTNLTSEKADLTLLPFKDGSIPSLSCMHTIEHIGLGRYGDPLDPNGDLKAIRELKRVTAQSGNLLFVVPIGQPKLMFNAHRIYSYNQVMNYFDGFELKQFVLIPDNAALDGIIIGASESQSDAQNYGCGCFWFKKK